MKVLEIFAAINVQFKFSTFWRDAWLVKFNKNISGCSGIACFKICFILHKGIIFNIVGLYSRGPQPAGHGPLPGRPRNRLARVHTWVCTLPLALEPLLQQKRGVAWRKWGTGCHVGTSTTPFVSHVLTGPFVYVHVCKMLPPPFPPGLLTKKGCRPLLYSIATKWNFVWGKWLFISQSWLEWYTSDKSSYTISILFEYNLQDKFDILPWNSHCCITRTTFLFYVYFIIQSSLFKF